MLLSQIEYDILRPIYRGELKMFDDKMYLDTIEYLLYTRMIIRTSTDDNEKNSSMCYQITTIGRQAYEACENYLLDEKRKDATLQISKKANTISIWAMCVSALSFLVSLAGLIFSLFK